MEKGSETVRQPDSKGFFTCLRCGHRWRSRTGRKPKVCPGRLPGGKFCHSAYWDTPRRSMAPNSKSSLLAPPFRSLGAGVPFSPFSSDTRFLGVPSPRVAPEGVLPPPEFLKGNRK